MKTLILPSLFLVILLIGCKTSVTLIMKTSDPFNHVATVSIKDKNKITKSELSSNVISVSKKDTLRFKAKSNSFFSVSSIMESGDGIVFKSPDFSLQGRPKSFTTEVELKTQATLIDDSRSLTTLSNSLKKLGKDLGGTPLDIKEALENNIGSLVVVNHDIEKKTSEIIYTVHPSILGVRLSKLEDLNWPNTSESEKIDVSGSGAASASATFPVIGKFGGAFENSKVYNLRWEMKGFGNQSKKEDADKSPAKMIESLPTNELRQISSKLRENKNAKLYYINQFYLLKNAELYIKEGKKNTTTGDVATAVITANGVFNFEQSEEKHHSYGDQILNYWGNEFTFSYRRENMNQGGDKVDFIDIVNTKDTGNTLEFSTILLKK